MRKNKFSLAVALLAALGIGCRRAAPPDESSPPTVELNAPEASPLTATMKSTTAFTNEMQAQRLRQEVADLGIAQLRPPSEPGAESDEARPAITYQEAMDRTRRYSKEFEHQRRVIESQKPRSISLPGNTPMILPSDEKGAPVQ